MSADIRATRWGAPNAVRIVTFQALRPLSDAEMDAMPDNCTPERFPDVAARLRACGFTLELDWRFREVDS